VRYCIFNILLLAYKQRKSKKTCPSHLAINQQGVNLAIVTHLRHQFKSCHRISDILLFSFLWTHVSSFGQKRLPNAVNVNKVWAGCACVLDLAVLREGGHGGALLAVGLGQAGADLQQVGLARLGDHHGVVEWSRHRALRLGLRLGLGLWLLGLWLLGLLLLGLLLLGLLLRLRERRTSTLLGMELVIRLLAFLPFTWDG